jgi:hypothetical protein
MEGESDVMERGNDFQRGGEWKGSGPVEEVGK